MNNEMKSLSHKLTSRIIAFHVITTLFYFDFLGDRPRRAPVSSPGAHTVTRMFPFEAFTDY